MNCLLCPLPAFPDAQHLTKDDEHRTVYIEAGDEESASSGRSWISHVITSAAGPKCLAIIQPVHHDLFEQFIHARRDFVGGEVLAGDNGDGKKLAFASPCLLASIRLHPVAYPSGVACIVEVESSASLFGDSVPAASETADSVPAASEVRIQFCGGYQVDQNTDVILADYFAKQRLLSLGSVFAVQAGPDEDSLFDRQPFPQRLTYFKVTSISPKPHGVVHLYRASTSFTSLKMDEGRANCRIPSLLEICTLLPPLQLPPASSAWSGERFLPCVPPGLDSSMKLVQRALLPTFCSNLLPGHLHLPNHILLTGDAGSGKKRLMQACCRWMGVNLFEASCHTLSGETHAAAEAKLKIVFDKAKQRSPCVLHLLNAEVLAWSKDHREEDSRLAIVFKTFMESLQGPDHRVVVVLSTTKAANLAPSLAQLFYMTVAMQTLTAGDRIAVLRHASRHHNLDSDVDLSSVAESLQGVVLRDLYLLSARAAQAGLSRIYSGSISLEEPTSVPVLDETVVLTGQDWSIALRDHQKAQSKELGAPKVPEVHWEDVGGLSEVRQEILDTIQLPLEHPELFGGGLKRSGILLFGPPGCGKTLLAKAVATECSLNFLSVKGPELLNMYVGQSEENVREVFAKARSAAPCVIFFDELDALAPNRGRSGDSGGVADRIVSQLLTELDGIGSDCNVFVIGATNRPDLIEPALLRPGRFDCRVYVGVYRDRSSQLAVLKALTRKFQFDSTVDLDEVASAFHTYMSGADVSAVCANAMMSAIQHRVDLLEAGDSAANEQDPILVSQSDLLHAAKVMVPSVSAKEIALYESMRSAR